MSSDTFKVGFAGGGPRGTLAIIYLAVAILTKTELSGLKFHVILFEKQDAENIACGHAWQTDCDAAANTGIPDLPDIPGIEKLDPSFRRLLNLSERVAEKAMAEKEAILERLNTRAPASAALFEKSFRSDGTFDTTKACITRGFLGTILHDCVNEALQYIRDNIPQLLVEIRASHEVVRADVSIPNRPKLIVRKVGETDEQEFTFDHIAIAQGTAHRPAVSAKLAQKTYSSTPNHGTIKAFLIDNDMLDEHGKLKPGKRVAFTGESLSALDYLGLMLAFLPCFVRDPSTKVGYYVDRELAAHYQGAFTFISRSGNPVPPRLSHSDAWRGSEGPFLTTRDMHALRLVPGHDWASIAFEFFRFNLANTLRTTPMLVNADHASSRDYMNYFLPQTEAYLEDPSQITEVGLVRGALLAFFLGHGFESDPKQAEKDLEAVAPFTRLGRDGWPMVASAGVEISKEDRRDTPDNRDFFLRRDEIRWHAAASPVQIQHSANLLVQAGVVVHQVGDFKDLDLSDSKIVLGSTSFHVLLAPYVISRDADPVIASLRGQVMESGGVPVYLKGRYLQSPAGVPINAVETGVGGWGVPLSNPKNGGRLSAERWSGDTIDFHSATLWADLAANQILMYFFIAANIPDANVHTFYKQILPSDDDFDREVETFRPDWNTLREKLTCILVCKALAGDDPAAYRKLTERISTDEGRKAFIAEQHQDVIAAFDDEQIMGKFRPPSLAAYEARFPDFTTPQIASMWELMFSTADK